MYLNLKLQQAGGYNNNQKTTLVNNLVSNKFDVQITNQEYRNIINKLNDFCKQGISKYQTEQIKEKVKNMFNELGEKKLSELNINDIFKDKKTLSNINWQEYHKKLCETISYNIIPRLEKQRNLQEKFIQELKNIKTNGKKIDIGKYIDFAKNNNMLDKSVKEIMEKFSEWVDNIHKYTTEEKKTNSQIMSYLASAAIPAQSILEQQQSALEQQKLSNTIPEFQPILSKSGKLCKTPCTKSYNIIHGEYCACKTDPYKSFLLTYDWDYCNPTECK